MTLPSTTPSSTSSTPERACLPKVEGPGKSVRYQITTTPEAVKEWVKPILDQISNLAYASQKGAEYMQEAWDIYAQMINNTNDDILAAMPRDSERLMRCVMLIAHEDFEALESQLVCHILALAPWLEKRIVPPTSPVRPHPIHPIFESMISFAGMLRRAHQTALPPKAREAIEKAVQEQCDQYLQALLPLFRRYASLTQEDLERKVLREIGFKSLALHYSLILKKIVGTHGDPYIIEKIERVSDHRQTPFISRPPYEPEPDEAVVADILNHLKITMDRLAALTFQYTDWMDGLENIPEELRQPIVPRGTKRIVSPRKEDAPCGN